jgi:hypothetical protein
VTKRLQAPHSDDSIRREVPQATGLKRIQIGDQISLFLGRVLGGMSIFTVLMTIPQVWTVWAASSSRDFDNLVERLPCVAARSATQAGA